MFVVRPTKCVSFFNATCNIVLQQKGDHLKMQREFDIVFIEGEKKNEKKTEEILYNVQMIKEEYKKKILL